MGLPMFAVGAYSKIQPAIESEVLKYPAYVFVNDEEHPEYHKKLIFLSKTGDLMPVVGDNKKQVVSVEELPSVENGQTDVLYIYDGVVYTFNGTEFKAQYQDISETLENIEERLNTLEETVDNLKQSESIKWIELE